MPKIFLSTRVTENFFSDEEIELIKKELQKFSKSAFIRKTIKFYLYHNKDIILNEDLEKDEVKELKNLIIQNQQLLKELKAGNFTSDYETKERYEGQEQEVKTEQALNLLNQF